MKEDIANASAERVRFLLSYDPDTGIFTYRTAASRRTPLGSIAGSVNDEGYRNIRVDGRTYKAHRLAWLCMTGEWPLEMSDHVDGTRDNNRFANLRAATRSQNLANSKIFRSGRSLPKGVDYVGSRWRARMKINGHNRFLGSFATQAAALAAYRAAAQEAFGDFARAM